MKDNFCYIHIPFCNSKCNYCRFASFGNLDKLKINLYLKFLINEIKSSSKNPLLNVEEGFLKSVYFGGGTPSILEINDLEKIINVLKEKYGFHKNIEITIEATPSTITIENLQGWKRIGINRLSIGVQTLNNKSLIEIGRGNKGDIFIALNNIKKTPLSISPNGREEATKFNISIDFIIGLPFVKKGEIKKNIEFILDNYSFVKHISVYMLEEYYEIPEEKESKFENITYPINWSKIGILEDEYLGEYVEIKNFLKSKGFNSYEISNFAMKGFESKHNKAYWNHSNILAFGLGAHGFVNNFRYSNSDEFLDYYSLKNIKKEKLNDVDLFLENLMFRLRTNGIDKSIYEKLNQNKLNQFIEDEYLEKRSNKIVLLDKGVLVLDYILGEII